METQFAKWGKEFNKSVPYLVRVFFENTQVKLILKKKAHSPVENEVLCHVVNLVKDKFKITDMSQKKPLGFWNCVTMAFPHKTKSSLKRQWESIQKKGSVTRSTKWTLQKDEILWKAVEKVCIRSARSYISWKEVQKESSELAAWSKPALKTRYNRLKKCRRVRPVNDNAQVHKFLHDVRASEFSVNYHGLWKEKQVPEIKTAKELSAQEKWHPCNSQKELAQYRKKVKPERYKFNWQERLLILKKTNGHCFGKWCGHRKLGPFHHMDHLVPWSKGGSDQLYNMNAMCFKCHHIKTQKEQHHRGDKLWFEFAVVANAQGYRCHQCNKWLQTETRVINNHVLCEGCMNWLRK